MLLRSNTVLAALLLQLAPPLAAPVHSQQQPAEARIEVHASDTGAPLAGAVVVARGVGMLGTTGADGRLHVRDLPPGAHALEVRLLGYRTERRHLRLEPGRVSSVEVDLSVEPIQLAEVRVEAAMPLLAKTGFIARQGSGFGTFVTHEEIAQMRPRFLSDVLRRFAGLALTPGVAGTARAGMRRAESGGRRCPIQYFIDGVMVALFNIDDIRPGDVEGMEIYRGASSVPPAFNRGSSTCGVVVIWTRVG